MYVNYTTNEATFNEVSCCDATHSMCKSIAKQPPTDGLGLSSILPRYLPAQTTNMQAYVRWCVEVARLAVVVGNAGTHRCSLPSR